MPTDHAELARRAWKAVSTADVATLAEVSTDDVAWHSAGRGWRAGTHRGREAILDYLAGIGENAESWNSELQDVLVGERFTGILFRVTGSREGRELRTDYLLLLRIEAGRIAEIWSVPRDRGAVDEFWA